MKKRLLSSILILTMLASLCTHISFAASDALGETVLLAGFDSGSSVWQNTTYSDLYGGVLALGAKPSGASGSNNTNYNWADKSVRKGLISYEFDYMIPSSDQITSSAQISMRDSGWIDNSVHFFAITSAGAVRKAFGDDPWANLYTLSNGAWYSFKVLLDTESGEYSVYVSPKESASPELLFKSEGRYSESNPAANGVRGVSFVNFRSNGTETVSESAYLDNVAVYDYPYAFEALADATSSREAFEIIKTYVNIGFLNISSKNLDLIGRDKIFEALNNEEITSDRELETLIASLAASEINGVPEDFIHTVDYENKIIYIGSSVLSPQKLCNELGINSNKAIVYRDSSLSELASYYAENGNVIDLNGDGAELYEVKVQKEHFVYQNFEDAEVGSDAKLDGFFAWSSMGENGSLTVGGDENGKYAHFQGTYVEGSGTNILFQSTEECALNVPSVISFDLKMNSYGKSRFELHLISNKTGKRLCVFAIAGSRMSCFEDYQQRVSLADTPLANGESMRFAIKIDPNAGTFLLYMDGELIREEDFETITTYKNRTDSSVTDFTMDLSSFLIRLDSNVVTLNESFDVEVDNVAVYPDRSIEEGISLCRPVLSDSGRKVSAYAEAFEDAGDSYDCYLSLYNGDELKAIDTQTVDLKSKFGANLELALPERADGNNYLAKMFVWDGSNAPLCRAVTFIGSEPNIPYAYELGSLLGVERSYPFITCSPADLERINTLRQTDENVSKWCADVIAKAERICTYSIDTKKWYNTPEEFYHIYYDIPDGVRLLNMTSKASEFIDALCLAYKLTDDTRYADRAIEIIMRVCGEGELGFPDWNPSHFLDVAAMCEGVATGYDLLSDYLSTEQKSIIITALKERALDPGIKAYKNNSFWTHDTSNWNPAVNLGLLQALLCVYGEDESYNAELEALLDKILHSLPLSIDTFYPDGAWYEGPRYAPVHNVAKVIDTLERAFGTDFGFFNRSGFSKVADYYTYVDGPAGVHNYSDCVEYSLSGSVLFWLADRLDNISLYNKQLSRQSLGGVDALLWYRPMSGNQADMPNDAYFREVELITMRKSSDDENGLWLSLCGGRTKHSHSHYDGGNFVLDYAGYRWASDLGSDTTNTTHYSTTYYFLEAYRARAEGHNVPVINPDSDPGQVDGFAKVEKSGLNTSEPYAVIDLSSVYDKADATKVKRGYKLLNGRTTALIRDEYTLIKSGEIYWFMHTQATPTIDGNTVILENPDGVKMKLEFKADNCESEVYIADAAPMTDKGSPNPEWQGKNTKFKKVAIKLTGNGNINLSVMISPYEAVTDINDVNSIEKW